MHVEEACAAWHFSIILISLRVEVAQISDFLVHAKILPLWKAFFNLYLPLSTLGQKQGMVWNGIENGIEWNGNFVMEYGRCHNGMEDFKNGME